MKLKKLEKYRCTYCNQLSDYLNQTGVEYESVNVEDNPEEASKYGVMTLPVLLLLDDDGNEVERMLGYNPGRTNEVDELVSKAN
jgi:thioredoxin 1